MSCYTIEDNKVLKNGKPIGELRKFCCGIDYRPYKRKRALFSIMGIKKDYQSALDCVIGIDKLKLPRKQFHWNFRPESLKRLDDYQDKLLKLA